MSKIVLKIRYLGTNYSGWQVQPNAPTVQSTLQDAVEKIFGVRYGITGCSRTDAGVHAKEYFCHLDNEAVFPALDKLPLALNSVLPKDIAVTGAFEADDDFHARYSALGKEYVYTILNSRIRDPFLENSAYLFYPDIDIEKLAKLAKQIEGTHDFTALSGADELPNGGNVRTVTGCNVKREGNLVRITVEGDGFLYNMVRIIVGTLLWAQCGKLELTIPEIIERKDRRLAGITAPAHGLCLNRVFYPKEMLKDFAVSD